MERRWCAPVRAPDTRTLREHLWLWLRRALCASFVAWIVSAPLVAHSFGIVAWGSTITAIVSAPLAGIILALGYAGVIAELAVPGSAHGAGDVLLMACEPLLLLVRAIDAVPMLHTTTPALSAWWALCTTVVIAWWCGRGLGRTKIERSVVVLCLASVTVWAAFEWRASPIDSDTALRVDTLAVGDGSCFLVRSGNASMLVDCGSTWTGAGVRAIPDALRSLGVRRLDRVVITHPDIDHYACLIDTASRIPIDEVVLGEDFIAQARDRPDGPARALLEGLDRLGIPRSTVNAGDAWTIGDARVDVLAPLPAVHGAKDNDRSLVVRTRVETANNGQRTLLLTGDIEDGAVRALRGAYPELRADIVEAPHHGSNNEEAAAFVASLRPEVVVQSTGPTRIDLPAWRAVRSASEWWCTALDGSVRVVIKTDGTIEGSSTSRASGRR